MGINVEFGRHHQRSCIAGKKFSDELGPTQCLPLSRIGGGPPKGPGPTIGSLPQGLRLLPHRNNARRLKSRLTPLCQRVTATPGPFIASRKGTLFAGGAAMRKKNKCEFPRCIATIVIYAPRKPIA